MRNTRCLITARTKFGKIIQKWSTRHDIRPQTQSVFFFSKSKCDYWLKNIKLIIHCFSHFFFCSVVDKKENQFNEHESYYFFFLSVVLVFIFVLYAQITLNMIFHHILQIKITNFHCSQCAMNVLSRCAHFNIKRTEKYKNKFSHNVGNIEFGRAIVIAYVTMIKKKNQNKKKKRRRSKKYC